jgi:hypothetical protein
MAWLISKLHKKPIPFDQSQEIGPFFLNQDDFSEEWTLVICSCHENIKGNGVEFDKIRPSQGVVILGISIEQVQDILRNREVELYIIAVYDDTFT